ncbi:ParB N-terminal domain-containing protein [Brevibacillus migulae]|uniref:hypothetical protein n=1 Tax=Brevibacillus migulae TaxID=1644114 RepID=UPI00106E09D9|nr:hypothetical protein [Brevibacillus migulae]
MEVEVSVVGLEESTEKALNLALNKISGGWDEEKLAQVLSDVQLADIEISLNGFGKEEIDSLLAQYQASSINEPVVDDNFDVGTALNEIKEPETMYGDVWQ